MTLGQLGPGDEVVVVFDGSPSAASSTADGSGATPSALPRQDAAPPPAEATEVMVFRAPRRP